jgi:hypothetical protein
MVCDAFFRPPMEGEMTDPMKDLDAYTDEELEQALARVLAHALEKR